MKNVVKKRLLSVLLIASTLSLTYCTKTDQVLDLSTPPPADNTANTNQLQSIKITSAPSIDGQIESMWDNAVKLKTTPVVPNPGNGMFIGYIGKSYEVSMRSMYDDTYIYFLAEWNDPDASFMTTAAILSYLKKQLGSDIKLNNLRSLGRVLTNMDGLERKRTNTGTAYLVKIRQKQVRFEL